MVHVQILDFVNFHAMNLATNVFVSLHTMGPTAFINCDWLENDVFVSPYSVQHTLEQPAIINSDQINMFNDSLHWSEH